MPTSRPAPNSTGRQPPPSGSDAPPRLERVGRHSIGRRVRVETGPVGGSPLRGSARLRVVSGMVVSNLAYAHPGGDVLFSNVSFKLGSGQHAGLVGANGVGKTTLFRVIAGQFAAAEGEVHIGSVAYMPQDV